MAHGKHTCRHVQPGQCQIIPHWRQRSEKIIGARIQKCLLAQCAGRHQTHHIAAHNGFGTAFFGLGGVFHLLANGNTVPLSYEPLKIAFGGMHRHPAHGHILAEMLAALGQGDVEGSCGCYRIVKEKFVKIAHPIKQQRIFMRGLYIEILRHHRRNGRRVGGLGRSSHGDTLSEVRRQENAARGICVDIIRLCRAGTLLRLVLARTKPYKRDVLSELELQ